MPRSGPRAVRKYSDEFKLTAVRLHRRAGYLTNVAADGRGQVVRLRE